MKCNNCGVENPYDAQFCKECGHEITERNNEFKDHSSRDYTDSAPQKTKKKSWWKRQTRTSKVLLVFLGIFIVGLIAAGFLGYSFLNATKLEVYNPLNSTMNEPPFTKLSFSGITDPNADLTLYLNGVMISNPNITRESDGNFNCTISNLPEGESVISLVANDPSKTGSRTAIMHFNRIQAGNSERWTLNFTYNITLNFLSGKS